MFHLYISVLCVFSPPPAQHISPSFAFPRGSVPGGPSGASLQPLPEDDASDAPTSPGTPPVPDDTGPRHRPLLGPLLETFLPQNLVFFSDPDGSSF